MRSIKGAFCLFLFLAWSALLVPLQMAVLLFVHDQRAYRIPRLWHQGLCRIFGIKVTIKGTPALEQQTIFICNHLSYLDILVIGSVLPASFVAKADVEGWPVFGFLSKLQQTAFIGRSRQTLRDDKYGLEKMLAAGRSLIIFPEGTSTDGQDVLPFKSALFALAIEKKDSSLSVQPMTLVVEQADGRSPQDQAARDYYAWHGDMTLAPHLWAFACGKGAVVRLVFHDCLKAAGYEDRKTLALACHEIVSKELTV